MLSSTSVVEAAEEAGLARRTIYRYLEEETFRVELRRRQDEALSGVTAALVGKAEDAVEVLHEVMIDQFASDSVRVRAALGWLRFVRDAVELEALSDRVRRLEEVVARGR
jgi:hypothetical protein